MIVITNNHNHDRWLWTTNHYWKSSDVSINVISQNTHVILVWYFLVGQVEISFAIVTLRCFGLQKLFPSLPPLSLKTRCYPFTDYIFLRIRTLKMLRAPFISTLWLSFFVNGYPGWFLTPRSKFLSLRGPRSHRKLDSVPDHFSGSLGPVLPSQGGFGPGPLFWVLRSRLMKVDPYPDSWNSPISLGIQEIFTDLISSL